MAPAPTLEAQVESAGRAEVAKKPYKNQTGGWLGVVKLDHLGAQRGTSVEPYGVVWLTDDEAKLTARAPKDPANNPFVEQTFTFLDGAGTAKQLPMCPLVLIADEEGVPGEDRYVPVTGSDEASAAVAAARAATQAQLVVEDGREVARVVTDIPNLMPSSIAAVPPSQSKPGAPAGGSVPGEPEEDERQSWTEPPADLTPTPKPGTLNGSDQPAPGPADGDAAQDGSPTAPGGPPQAPVAQTAASVPAPVAAPPTATQAPQSTLEEHAAQTSSGEETGAADTPVGTPPEGEFAQHEEVGSPDAPTATRPGAST